MNLYRYNADMDRCRCDYDEWDRCGCDCDERDRCGCDCDERDRCGCDADTDRCRCDRDERDRCGCDCDERDRCGCDCDERDRCRDDERQRHVHEIIGSTAVYGEGCGCHNHRFATVSGEAIPYGDNHVHEVKFRTDFADGHYHEFYDMSSPAIGVGNGKHVHFASARTEEEDGHTHRFQVASLIDSPLDFECD